MAEEFKKGITPTILNLLGLLFSTLFTFMGLIYVLHGNYWLSSFISLIVLVVLFVLTDRMAAFKIRKTKQLQEPNFLPEFVLGGMYVLVFLGTFFFIFHFIDVDFNRKNELIKEGLDKLNAMKELRKSYAAEIESRKKSFQTHVETLLDGYIGASGYQRSAYKAQLDSLFPNAINYRQTDNSAIRTQVASLISRQQNMMNQEYTLDALNPEYDAYYRDVSPIFENWNFLKVSYYFKDADVMFDKLYTAAKTKMPEFNFSRTDAGNTGMDDPVQSLRHAGVMEILAVLLLMIIIHLCILAPYIAASRYVGALKTNPSVYKRPEKSIKL